MEQQQNTPVTGTPVTFRVDLTREEYVNYYTLFARTVGPLRGRLWQLITAGVMCLILLAVGLYEFFYTGVLDWALFGLILAWALLTGFLWLYLPSRLKKQAARMYDESVESGYSYFGIVEVRPTEIRKIGRDLVTTVPFNAKAVFIENKDILMWMSQKGRAIVIPARCLTPETAAAVRAAADQLPAQNRRLVGRLVPGCQPVPVPPPVETVILWQRQVYYTPEEFAAVAKGRVVNNYWRRLPQLTALAFLTALVLSWSESSVLPGLVFFLLAMAVLTVFNLVLPYSRISRSMPPIQGMLPGVQVTFTDRGIQLRDGKNFATFPWHALEHAYDRGDYAELQFHKQAVRIPKREIEDIEAFNAILKEKRQNKK